jgi:hypothetical protein
MLQSATLAKGAVTGKRTSTHSCHPWIAAISTATLPFCLKEEYHGERCQINIQEFRVKIRLSVSQRVKKCGKPFYASRIKVRNECMLGIRGNCPGQGMYCDKSLYILEYNN